MFIGLSVTTQLSNAFRELKSFTTLDLGRNNIDFLENFTFNGLIKLESLKLDYNKLVNLEDNIFSNLINLKFLDISLNDLVLKSTQFLSPK